jgi:hypothetical protein
MRRVDTRPINLASQPFRAERAQTALLAGVCAALLVSLGVLGGLILHARSEAEEIAAGPDAVFSRA